MGWQRLVSPRLGDGWGRFCASRFGHETVCRGNFTKAGEIAATNIAKWDGSAWSALGSGMNGPVVAVALSDTNLYAGGGFTKAGGKVSVFISRAFLSATPEITSQPVSQTVMEGSTASFSVTATGLDPLTYKWSKNGESLADGDSVSGADLL